MAKKMWGGRFKAKTSRSVERFTHSLAVDRRLAKFDLLGSMAHARMLGKTGIIPKRVSARLVKALGALVSAEKRGAFTPNPEAEDIHTAIQLALEKRVGTDAHYLQSARSRNDQVVTALRLYCKEEGHRIQDEIRDLERVLLTQASRARGIVLPGYTHLRHAQPILAGHLLISYLEMLQRDRERLREALHRLDALPLGSCALAGTALPIRREAVARELGFSHLMENSIDGVTDRDFVVEILAALSLLGIHLSRIAEDLLLFSTAEFGFASFQERLLTGSSMMPHKQNPDFLELTRAGSAKITGTLLEVLMLVKGLPSGYQRDLQGDKEPLFRALDHTHAMLEVLTQGMQGLRWNPDALSKHLADDALYATDLVEHLVSRGVPFAQAHQAIGRLLTHADARRKKLAQLPLSVWKRFSPLFTEEAYRLLSPAASLQRKRSPGSSAYREVNKALSRWKKKLSL